MRSIFRASSSARRRNVVARSLSSPGQAPSPSTRTARRDVFDAGGKARFRISCNGGWLGRRGRAAEGRALLAPIYATFTLRQLGAEPVAYGPGLADRVKALAPDGVTAAADLFGTETAETALALGVPPERISTIAAGPNSPAACARPAASTPPRRP